MFFGYLPIPALSYFVTYIGCFPLWTFGCIDSGLMRTESSSKVVFADMSLLKCIHQRFD
jgi:hypothetical protein